MLFVNEQGVLFQENNREFHFDKNYYEDEKFRKLSLSQLRLNDVEFFNCEFNGVVLEKSTFNSCRFEKCSFKNCDLSVSKINNSSFLDVKFENCKLIGIDWTKICQPVKLDFLKCKLNDCIFFNMDLRSTNFISCEVHNSDFEQTNLSKGDLTFSDFLNSSFSNTNLSYADFTDARNYRINPAQNNIRKAKFSLPEAIALLDQWDIIIK
ncbi:MAG: hypothetical protein CVV24_14855 [Ignavibacteriae bacterium HGW-Ignavibacteriae-3]|nr:MAG: hypothetical protein CVV24_14855 [Ignavibacteriae bacterium HGW-Ignavibacteriae-3]